MRSQRETDLTKQRDSDPDQPNYGTEAEPEKADPAAGDEPDFAEEHTDVTLADQLEGMPEPEAPKGYAGLESRGLERRRPSDDT